MGRPKLYPHQLPNVLVDDHTQRAIEAELDRRRAYDQRTPQSDVVRDFLAAGARLADEQAAGKRVRILLDDTVLTDTDHPASGAWPVTFVTPERDG